MKRGAIITAALVLLAGGAARYRPTPDPPRTWRVTIPHWQPTTQRLGKAAGWLAMQRDRLVVGNALENAGVPYSEDSRDVSVTITLKPNQHTPRDEAVWASIEDALSMCGRAGEITRGPVVYRRGNYAETMIEMRGQE